MARPFGRCDAGPGWRAGGTSASCSSNTAFDSSGASATGGVSGRASGGSSNAGGGSAGALATLGGTSAGGASNRAGAPSTGGTDQAAGAGGATDNAAGATGAGGAGGADAFAAEHDTYGSAASAPLDMAGPAEGGNVIQMNRAMILRGFSQQVKLTADQTLSFFVYEADQINGPYAFLWSADVQETAGEANMVPSPPLALRLEVNKFYWLHAATARHRRTGDSDHRA